MAGPPKRPATIKPSRLHLRGTHTPERVVIPELSKYEPKEFTAKAIKENVKKITKKDVVKILKKTRKLNPDLQKRYLLSLGIDARLLKNMFTELELARLLTKQELLNTSTKQELRSKLTGIELLSMGPELLYMGFSKEEINKLYKKK